MKDLEYSTFSVIILPPGSTSADLQTAINNATSGDTIIISDNMTFSGTVTIAYGKTIEIQSDAGNTWTLTKTTSGSHFNISGHLILQNIVVDGETTGGNIYVGITGDFTMNTGTVIQNCNNSGVTNQGTFIMNDGIIKNNSGSSQGYGGGVYNASASFTMNGGSIIENSARNGGGINSTGSVTINNGTISNNHATLYGGGITVNLMSSCTMRNGIISNNISDRTSAGIHVLGKFTMSGGSIIGNHAITNGGGIYAAPNGDVTISKGTISQNIADNNGGGIYVNLLSKANITGAERECYITNNSAPNGNGGGIYVVDTTYSILNTSNDTIFSCNTASIAYEPPNNASTLYPTIQFASTSITDHPLNNFDINYTDGEPIDVTFNVTYNANGGIGSYTGPDTVPGGTDTILTIENTGISREGYTFTGWNTEPDGSGTEYEPGDAVTLNCDVTLYAQWTAAPSYYTVTYNANGGTGSYVDTDIPYGTEYPVLSANATGISRKGHTFTGWNTEPDGSGRPYAPGDVITVTENQTLYAQWEAAPSYYTVTYNANGGTGNYVEEIPYGTESTVLSANATGISREGHTFTGWNTEPDGSGRPYAPGDVITVTENQTLYAQWEAAPSYYTVTYNANGGTGSYVEEIPYGTEYTVLSANATGISRKGYTLTGWNTEPDGSGISYASGDRITVDGNITLYAQWISDDDKPDCKEFCNKFCKEYCNEFCKEFSKGCCCVCRKKCCEVCCKVCCKTCDKLCGKQTGDHC